MAPAVDLIATKCLIEYVDEFAEPIRSDLQSVSDVTEQLGI
jgi:hypothetical protein